MYIAQGYWTHECIHNSRPTWPSPSLAITALYFMCALEDGLETAASTEHGNSVSHSMEHVKTALAIHGPSML